MIKKLVLSAAVAMTATAASAADLPRRAEAPVFTPVPVFTWTGFYFGTHTSYGQTDNGPIRTRGNDLAPTNTILNVAQERRPSSIRAEQDNIGKIGGGFGVNWQLTPGNGFVLGAEASWTWSDLTKSRFYLSPPHAANNGISDPSSFRQSLDWIGFLTARVGYGFDRLLVYGTGGLAYGNVLYDANFFRNTDTALAYAGRFDGLEVGYAYGGGIEYALPEDSFLRYLAVGRYLGIKSDAITIKAEYLRYDLGSRNVVVNSGFIPGGPGGSYTSRFTTEGSLIRAGFNYKY